MTVAAVLALAVVGTGAALRLSHLRRVARVRGEPPVIKADNSPTKVVPAPRRRAAGKTPGSAARRATAASRLVSREEKPVDVNRGPAHRVWCFRALNPNGNPPPAPAFRQSAPPWPRRQRHAADNEPRRIRTLAVKGDADNGGVPPAPTRRRRAPRPARHHGVHAGSGAPTRNPASANASANAPMSLAPNRPQAEPPPRRRDQSGADRAGRRRRGGGSYLVAGLVAASEAEAQAPTARCRGISVVLGSRPPVIKRADLGARACITARMVGPFRTRTRPSQFCGSLKAAGGQCVVQRN